MPANIKQHIHGFSLIEVLVALVILAVGLLGVAGLQANSLRNTYSANLRSQATTMAQDMIERIRANRDFALQSNANYAIALNAEPPADATDCRQAACTSAELANHDKSQWLSTLQTLPTGNGQVTVDTANDIATVTVMWDNDRTGATGTNCSGNPQIDLTCFRLAVKP